MNDLETVRVLVYTHAASTGAPPTSASIAQQLGMPVERARDMLAELGAARRVVLDATTGEIWMAAPFSAVPTRFRVIGAAMSWWANCAWDMFGIPAMLRQSARVEARCADCDETIVIDVDAETGPRPSPGLVHFLVPARRWYENIGFT